MEADGITRFGVTGLMVPAISIVPLAFDLARANSFASDSFSKVFVARCARSPSMSPLAR
jgi:hypothetical protein